MASIQSHCHKGAISSKPIRPEAGQSGVLLPVSGPPVAELLHRMDIRSVAATGLASLSGSPIAIERLGVSIDCRLGLLSSVEICGRLELVRVLRHSSSKTSIQTQFP